MGDVFLARDPILKRNVAVKVLAEHLGLSAQARQRFAREAEAAAAVAHPNVVPIYRVGTLPRSQLGYIVMAHVDGPTLRELIPAGTVGSETEVRRITAEIGAALAAAHSRGVIHRDIKPANVLCDELGGRFVVVDFGIASVLSRDTGGGPAKLTLEGVPVGTPEYMSPEQAAGDPVGEKSDVYSLGCLAYELLAGRPPIGGATVGAVVMGHLHQTPVPVSSLRPELSPEFAALVTRCLAKDPDERPAAEEVTRALGFASRTVIEWPPPGLEGLHRAGAHWSRILGRFAAALLLFVLVLGIHPAGARPCCAGSPDRSPGWLLLKRLSMVTPIHFDDPDALSIWYFLLDLTFFLALAALIPFAIRTVRLAGRLMAARRSGYPVSVLARVAWDRHRDTRDLVNLTGRYALFEPRRQRRHLRLRATASLLGNLALALLIGSCFAWLGGWLDLPASPAAGLLPFSELALVAGPPLAAGILYLVLEGLDFGTRGSHRVRTRGLRPEVLGAWMAAAGAAPQRERWGGGRVAIGAAAIAGVAIGMLAVVVAAYGLIAVFGASARFAGDRALAAEWLRAYQAGSTVDSLVPPLEPRAALALVATIPLSAQVVTIMQDPRLNAEERRRLVVSVGPAFCLNPREVLFGVAPGRLQAWEGARRLIGIDVLEAAGGFEPGHYQGGGLMGLRRRARYCEQFFGGQASISPQARPIGGR
jgi:hypothetical protein